MMATQIGSPSFFITLTAADNHWFELLEILKNSGDFHNFLQYTQLVNHHPLLVTEFFNIRCKYFLEVLKSELGITDYW
jgi:hypothetical protein